MTMDQQQHQTTQSTVTKGNRIMRTSNTRTWLPRCVAALAGLGLLATSLNALAAGTGEIRFQKTRVAMSAGTVFDLNNLDAEGKLLPFPWKHQVRGIAQVSNLGNCRVFFDVSINPGSDCKGKHLFCLSGTMTVTTLAGDKLETEVVGWADPDPKDPKPNPTMFKLHYDVTITGGTGKLAGARGLGDVEGAFMFAGAPGGDADPTDDLFCEGYAGVATWQFDGLLMLPYQRR
jgi:hypothetical protein